MTLSCTACRELFHSPSDQKEHFRSDWHRYNLKRKVVNLPPVSLEQYNARTAQAVDKARQEALQDRKQKQRMQREEQEQQGLKTLTKCVACNKQFSTTNAYENHIVSKKHKAQVKKHGEDASQTISKSLTKPEKEDQEDMAKSLEEYRQILPLDDVDCIFCSHKASSLDTSLEHMLKEHGFFLPDVEFLEDLSGLIGYLSEKVKIGHLCLYCDEKSKNFTSYQDVQKHMRDANHCKLPYETQDEIDELMDFYDYSPKQEVEWETDSEASIHSDDEVEEEEEEEEQEQVEPKEIAVSETGELVLPNGRRLGRREFRRYYKQRFRPTDDRESVQAATKEKLLLTYRAAGVAPEDCQQLSTAFVANFLRRRNNIADNVTAKEARTQRHFVERQKGRLEDRSHKLQKFPNRKRMVTV